MINLALVLSLTLRLLLALSSSTDPQITPRKVLLQYESAYGPTALTLMAIGLVFFSAFGFYSRGRAYRGKYKALIVGQAVTLTYLTFGFCTFLFRFGGGLPRAGLL